MVKIGIFFITQNKFNNMKKLLFLIVLGSTSAIAQVNSNQPVVNSIAGQNPFLDASTNFNDPGSVGKGLVFPQANLTTWTFDTSALDGINFPTAFDGMIVYNTATGSTLENQGQIVSVTPGFYYFSNPGATDNITNGQWIKIAATGDSKWVDGTTPGDIVLNNPLGSQNINYSNRGIRAVDKSGSIVDAPPIVGQPTYDLALTNNYNLNFIKTQNIPLTPGEGSFALIPNEYFTEVSPNNRVGGSVFNMYSTMQIPSANASNYTSLRGGSFASRHYGSGLVTNLTGLTSGAILYNNARASVVYGSYFTADLNTTASTPTVYGSSFNTTMGLSQTGNVQRLTAVQARNLLNTSSVQVGDLYGFHLENRIPTTYTGTITNSYDYYSTAGNVTAPGQIINKYGMYILGSTKKNYFEGSLGMGTNNPAVKLDVNGYVKLGSADTTGDALPQPGMMRYNATTDKFQGYVNNAGSGAPGWVDLN